MAAGDLRNERGDAGAVTRSEPPECAVASQVCEFLFGALEGMLPFDRIAIVSIEDDERLVQRAVRAREPDRVIPAGYGGTLRRGTLAAVVAGGHPRTLNRLAAYAANAPSSSPTHLLVQEGYQSSLTCPLEHEGTAVALIYFNSRTPDVFRPEHAEVVQRLAPTVAALLAGGAGPGEPHSPATMARSLAAIGRAARVATEEEVLVARILDRVRDGVVVDDVLNRLYDHCHTLLPYDRIGYATVQGDRVVAQWARSRFAARLPRGFSQPLSGGSLSNIIEAGTPRILNDLVTYSALHPHSRSTQLIVEEGHRASLTFFLGTPETPLGFLYFSSGTANAYRHDHVARMRRLTAPLTAALERALLFEQLIQARERSEELLRMLVPPAIAARLHAGETDIADAQEATILFADLANFTGWSASLSPIDLLHTLRDLFARIHASAERRGVARIRVMGDGYMAVAGADDHRDDHAERAALHALDIVEIAGAMRAPDGRPLAARVGLHTGPIVAGVLGGGDLHYDAWGPAVSIAARLESHGAPGRVQVSEETARRLAGAFALEPRGEIQLKGLGLTRAWWLRGAEPTPGGT